MKRALVVLAAAALVSLAIPLAWTATQGAQASGRDARAVLHDGTGQKVGVARFSQRGGVVRVRVNATGLTPGFHGFHVHATGLCEAPFTTAGGHLNVGGASHPNHAGDMPVLLINADGTGEARFATDRYGIEQLFDADGSALIIHAGADNYANIPAARYDPDPDATTLATGDAGARAACAVIQAH